MPPTSRRLGNYQAMFLTPHTPDSPSLSVFPHHETQKIADRTPETMAQRTSRPTSRDLQELLYWMHSNLLPPPFLPERPIIADPDAPVPLAEFFSTYVTRVQVIINEQQSTKRLLAVVNETRHWLQAFIVHHFRMTSAVRNMVQQLFFGLRYMFLTWNAHAIHVERELHRVHLVLLGMRDDAAAVDLRQRGGRVRRVLRRLVGRKEEVNLEATMGSMHHVLNRLLELPPPVLVPIELDVRVRFRLPSTGFSERVREIMAPGNSYDA